jgi:hypothetical protein
LPSTPLSNAPGVASGVATKLQGAGAGSGLRRREGRARVDEGTRESGGEGKGCHPWKGGLPPLRPTPAACDHILPQKSNERIILPKRPGRVVIGVTPRLPAHNSGAETREPALACNGCILAPSEGGNRPGRTFGAEPTLGAASPRRTTEPLLVHKSGLHQKDA